MLNPCLNQKIFSNNVNRYHSYSSIPVPCPPRPVAGLRKPVTNQSPQIPCNGGGGPAPATTMRRHQGGPLHVIVGPEARQASSTRRPCSCAAVRLEAGSAALGHSQALSLTSLRWGLHSSGLMADRCGPPNGGQQHRGGGLCPGPPGGGQLRGGICVSFPGACRTAASGLR